MEEEPGQRAVAIGVMVLATLVGTALVTLGHDDPATPGVAVVAADTSATTTLPTPSTTTAVGETTTSDAAPTTTIAAAPTTDSGALPQTDEKPTASGATFTAGVDALWEAI